MPVQGQPHNGFPRLAGMCYGQDLRTYLSAEGEVVA